MTSINTEFAMTNHCAGIQVDEADISALAKQATFKHGRKASTKG